MILPAKMRTDVRPAKRPVQGELRPQTIDRATAQAIVFGTSLARSLLITETPEALVGLTAERIWDNFETYFLLGEWPMRPDIEDIA
jgi:hypothetical protein